MKIWFFIFIFPLIIFGELFRFLHNRKSYPILSDDIFHEAKLRTRDGKFVHITYTKNFERCVLIVHGFLSSSKRSLLKYHTFLRNNKFDVVTVDFRNHGKSSLSLPVTNGYHEKWDVIAALKWSSKYWNERFIISTSMGAYITGYAMAALIDQNQKEYLPKKAVLESFGINVKIGSQYTFSAMFGLPHLLSTLITIYIQLRLPEIFILDIKADLRKVNQFIPFLIAHGTADKIYPGNIYQPLFQRLLKNGEFLTIQGADHSQLYEFIEFQNRVKEFLLQT